MRAEKEEREVLEEMREMEVQAPTEGQAVAEVTIVAVVEEVVPGVLVEPRGQRRTLAMELQERWEEVAELVVQLKVVASTTQWMSVCS